MKRAIAILAVLSVAAFAVNQIPVNLPPVDPQGTDTDWLQYDDGTAHWLTWGGMYRGTWFDVTDFIPGGTAASVQQGQMWFYHHASYPWDTSDFYMELWNGDVMTPTVQLDQTVATAVHYSPVTVTYPTPIETEANFWLLANTEMSAGGWPSILGDNTPGDHSYFSDDFIVWESWGDMGDYFISVYADITAALDNTTWGALKATF